MWNRLPDEIAVRFNTNNEVLSYSPKGFAVFGIPIMMFVCHFFCMLPLCGGMLLYSLGIAIDLTLIVELVLGIVFLMIGNYLLKCRPNDIAAAKTLGTIGSEDMRYRIQRFVGWCYALMGICIFVNCFLQNKLLLISMIVLSILIPIVCSIVGVRNYIKNN